MSSPIPDRHERQDYALERADDLFHDFDAVWDGSSPVTVNFRAKASVKIESLKRRFSSVDNMAPPSPAQKRPRLPPALDDVPSATSTLNADLQSQRDVTLSNCSQDRSHPRTKRVEERYASLLHHLNEETFSSQTFLTNIENPVGGEHAAFAQLSVGYSNDGCLRDWKQFLSDKFSSIDVSWLSNELGGIEKRADLEGTDRIRATHLALQDTVESTNKKCYIEFLISHISVLSFGMDWREIKGKNSNKIKQEFYESMYQSIPDNKALFGALTAQECLSAINNDHAAPYTAWRAKIDAQITARNRFVDLYLAYGPIVFLDPFWDVRTLTNSARHKDFPALFKYFIENVPEEEGVTVTVTRWRGSFDALGGVVSAIDTRLAKCMKSLLDKYPDDV
ncbi:hypothetical protein B0H16DRAFT_1726404 [Mycena metata]|uniref:Uncharacterized protein n=1 Tax=Mycena metata TaxID=1033252 RepID=A0AAD7IPR5_9AGAR|nr:hypothetical protein B0H16DRAFT_1726404 [Mycena metata]